MGEHVLDQPRRTFHHPPRPARRAPAPAPATERHPVLMAAAYAHDAHESLFQPTAAKVALKLPVHERGQRRTPLTHVCEEGLRVLPPPCDDCADVAWREDRGHLARQTPSFSRQASCLARRTARSRRRAKDSQALIRARRRGASPAATAPGRLRRHPCARRAFTSGIDPGHGNRVPDVAKGRRAGEKSVATGGRGAGTRQSRCAREPVVDRPCRDHTAASRR